MILNDGDVILYRCGFAAQKTRYKVTFTNSPLPIICENAAEAKLLIAAYLKEDSNIGHSREPFLEVEPVENALHNVKTTMESIQARFPERDPVVFFSCPTKENWRTRLYPQYKANRKPRKPEHYEAMKKYMWRHYHCEFAERFEADDLIAIWAHEHRNSVIVTNDKDMDQIPGIHYDFTQTREYLVLPHEAGWCLDLQIVAGDTVDNIPGVPGMGMKRAAVALEECDDPAIVYDHYYDTQEAADYWFKLNQAMVTLPMDPADPDNWAKEIDYARKALEDISEDGEGPVSVAGGTGASESGSPTAEEGV